MIEGDDARKVFRAVNIRFWPMKEMPTSGHREYGLESEGSVSRDEMLNTAQSHLHGPTVQKYMTEGAPEEDPDYEGRRYLPEVYTSLRGRKWIDEGHHRLVASRLRGDYSAETYEGYLL
ncbi:hypothetical protein EBT25_15455 [bacterium]|jgi:hypothetical protein|nr:hypothetical protein [bacterium]